MANLKTDYKDDILDTSVNMSRKYRQVTNADGTISLEDVTVYLQEGDIFGASDINQTNEAINNISTSADHITFDDSVTQVGASDVQDAINKVYTKLGTQVTFSLSGTTLTITTK